MPAAAAEGGREGVPPTQLTYKYVGVRGGTRRERRLLLLLGGLLLLALILAITAIALHAGYHRELSRHIEYCNDGECIKAGAQLSQTLDRSVDPCHDFYQFACGRWARSHPVPDKGSSSSWFSEGAAALGRAVAGAMEGNSSEEDPRAVHLMRDYFHSCIDKDALSQRGLEPLEWILEQLGLTLHPPRKAPSALPLGTAVGRAQRLLSLDVLLELSIIRDVNNSLRILMVTPARPSLLSVQLKGARGAKWTPTEGPVPAPDLDPFMQVPTRALSAGDLLKAELLFMTEVIQMLSAAQPMTTQEAARIAADIILFESQLKNMTEVRPKTRNTTFYDFQKLFDDSYEQGNFTKQNLMDLETYVSALSEGLNRSLDYINDVIVVRDPHFFSRLARSLADTGPLSTWRHLWWRVVHALLPYAPPQLLSLERRFHRRVLGQRSRSRPTRRSTCAMETKREFPGAAAFTLNRMHPIADSVSQVEDMLVHVRAAFEELVHDAAWMDQHTREKTIEKLRDIDSFIGYPQWAGDGAAVDEQYADLSGVSAEEYLRNAVAMKGRSVRQVLEGLGATTPDSQDTWDTVDPIQVNAFYTRLSNSIVIPAGILQNPFFRKGHEGLNYASIGAILGHELTHGFDSEGRHWDKHGRRSDWWSKHSAREYSSRAHCFVEQYNRFRLPGRRRVDGELTLAENIADNGGVREALRAFNRRLRRRSPPPPPPALHDFTPEQLFFLGFANLWCHKASTAYEDIILKDNHSPARFRVLGSLANAPAFARAWGCAPAAHMHPRDKCIVW